MIPSTLRLKRSRVAYLLNKGKKLNNDYLTAKFLPSPGKTSHFCVTVSSKVAKNAVDRNRLRRQVYEIIRLNHQSLANPCDLILICKKSLTGLGFADLQTVIIKTFKAITIK
ncbi:MAG TPA: ribonuclease P protein component [Candidatus Gracilibacteria bacterium]|nr:ribonuclease P protein component [Candidatus Gracilibacteria bacterium]HRY91272.1 ribonuclease P protein component [Candidatus Gracilibacteria bacterium]